MSDEKMIILMWKPQRFTVEHPATKAVLTVWENPSLPRWEWSIRRKSGEKLAEGIATPASKAKAAARRKHDQLLRSGVLNDLRPRKER